MSIVLLLAQDVVFAPPANIYQLVHLHSILILSEANCNSQGVAPNRSAAKQHLGKSPNIEQPYQCFSL